MVYERERERGREHAQITCLALSITWHFLNREGLKHPCRIGFDRFIQHGNSLNVIVIFTIEDKQLDYNNYIQAE